MKQILVATVAVIALSGPVMADTITLSDAQLDGVTAGWGWKRSSGGVSQSNSNSTHQRSSSGAVSVGGCNVVAFCGGFLNGNALSFSSSGNYNETYQANENGGGGPQM